MERSRKQKLLMIIALMLSIASLSIGFAAFSVAFNISSSASVSPDRSTFNVKFSTSQNSLVVSEIKPSEISSDVTAGNGIIDNTTSPLLTNLTATFTAPGQYVEYIVYARNEGEYIAYLNSINFIGEKSCTLSGTMTTNVQSACDAISMKVIVGEEEYTKSTEIRGHTLAKKSGEKIKVKIAYDLTGGWADSAFKVKFSDIMMVYSTMDDSTYVTSDVSGGTRLLIDEVKRGAMLDNNLNILGIGNPGKYLRNGTQNDEYPIYYHRGNITYVSFADLCWKVVRTTETGGIKILYSGGISSTGACAGTSTLTSKFSEYGLDDVSLADVGYMYGKRIKLSTEKIGLYNGSLMYGKGVVWNGSTYQLQDTITDSLSYSLKANGYVYTCGNTSGDCTSVKLIYDYLGNVVQTFTLSDGEYLEDLLAEVFENIHDSAMKKTLDAWYEENLLDDASKLEDTIWCNNRKLVLSNGVFVFDTYNRLNYNMGTREVLLGCPQENDQFTVSPINGNGALKYPIGLLTVDELFMTSDNASGSMSPLYVFNTGSTYNDGAIMGTRNEVSAYKSITIRPSISLVHDTKIVSGSGTNESPYVVE